MRTVFELKVWQKKEQSCFFLLLWDNRRRKLTASLPYSKEIQKWYQLWQQRYYRFYQVSSLQPPSHSGRLNPGSGDLAHNLTEAERELIQAFQRWLGEGEARNIQQQIRNELVRMTQATPQAAKRMAYQAGVDIFLACDADEMTRLPWEAWLLASEFAAPGVVRIIRTAMDEPEAKRPLKPAFPHRKPRILAILGDDPHLPLQEDWKAIRSLKSIAHVERFTWQPEDTVATIKKKIAEVIGDTRGWDVLFFAGHSDETTTTGGQMAITPNVSFSISDIEEYLTHARENGLQLAIFNSCNGLSIANSLVDLGLQVVVMREPIRNDVAQSFLTPLCQQLAKHKDIHEALFAASQHLESAEKFAYPSAHLVPSFFSPSGAVAYRIKPFGWKKQLQQWLPNRRETLILTTAILFSFAGLLQLEPLKDFRQGLLNRRIWVQAIYRNLTNQFSQNESPPVLLLAIDQESINQADQEIVGFQTKPMDREYLAKLITQLSASQIKVIGIDYLLNTQEPREETLAQAIHQSVMQGRTWFVFATRERDELQVREQIAHSNWSLRGDAYARYWQVKRPADAVCTETCPFAYMLSLASTLNEQASLNTPRPDPNSQTNFHRQISLFLQNADKDRRNSTNTFLENVSTPFELPLIVDYSIPPTQVYKHIPAWELLDNPELQQSLNQRLAIIASGGYVAADDSNFEPLLPALQYWCTLENRQEDTQKNCSRSFTGGELHAYTSHHLLSSHRVIQIPDWWIVFAAALLGKWVALTLAQQPEYQRQKSIFPLSIAPAIYGLIGLQTYIGANILLPWLSPSVIFYAYIIGSIKKKWYS